MSLGAAAAEIARTNLPDQIAAVFEVVGADRTLAGVVGETTLCGPAVERFDRVARQRPEAHRRDVEQCDVVGLGAIWSAQSHRRRQVGGHPGPQRMPQELIADGVEIVLGSERFVAFNPFSPPVHGVAALPVKRCAVGVGLDKILIDLRADQLRDEPGVAQDRVGAQNRVALLQQVPGAQAGQGRQHRGQDPPARTDVESHHGYGDRGYPQRGHDEASDHLPLLRLHEIPAEASFWHHL